MLGMITIVIALLLVILIVITSERDNVRNYKRGYNDCILDIDEVLADWKNKDIESVGIETMRNRIAQEYMGDE